MDRHSSIQIIAILLVLATLVRWIPSPDGDDFLGRGDPLRSLELDALMQDLGSSSDEARAYLRAIRRKNTGAVAQYWVRRLRQVKKIKQRADGHTFVQFKGLLRNEQYLLRYDLYPIPTVGDTAEDGSTADDPTLDGAEVIVNEATVVVTPEEAKAARQAQRQGARQQRTPAPGNSRR